MSGVQKGSVLGSSLFLFYINDIPDGMTSTVRLFADDTIAYLTIKSNRDCTTLQNDLDKLSIWEQKWKMAFHPDKCNVLSITRNKTPIKYSYTLHGHQLEHADKVKYLGVTIQSDLKWDSHINSITTKANRKRGFLRRNINISSTTVKEQAYKSLVRPSLEYACSVWDPYTKGKKPQLEQVQRMAARLLTASIHVTPLALVT
jgi:myo-inositol-hexaphosphate 3-phosphohydrolase